MRGKLCGGSHSHIARRDHPRGCGENVTAYDPAMSGTGSPPRMRGKRGRRVQENAGGRITPADAGKTGGDMQIRVIVRDHPRGCGENCKEPYLQTAMTGSPPRMRGKLNGGMKNENYHEDHPRGCGENYNGYCHTYNCTGSPPRMRGKQHLTLSEECCIRITPAGAGKTYTYPPRP